MMKCILRVLTLYSFMHWNCQIDAAKCLGNRIEWCWVGAITSHSVSLVIKSVEDEDCLKQLSDIYIRVSHVSDPTWQKKYTTFYSSAGYNQKYHLHDLIENQHYRYVIYSKNSNIKSKNHHLNDDPNNKEDRIEWQGEFRTPGKGAYNFTFGMSSCADQSSDPKVLNAIESHMPLFFLHMGDLHYENINENNATVYRNGYNSILRSPFGKKLLQMNTPIIYMWDDHDYGPDNSDKTALGREAALLTYREYVPHYPLQDDLKKKNNNKNENKRMNDYRGAIYQAFTIGRIHFILTDLRSERTPNLSPDDGKKSVLGSEQKEWFKKTLLEAQQKQYGAILWCSTMPWLDNERKWGHFKKEQQELVDFIHQHNIQNLYIVSGDAHMVAVDDGTHSPGKIPVFHAAALGRKGSVKGGPYSHGAFPGNGQFAMMQVIDKGDTCIENQGHKCVCLRFSGRGSNNEIIQEYDTCHPETTIGQTYYPPPILIRKMQRGFRKLKQYLWNHLLLAFLCSVIGFGVLFCCYQRYFWPTKRNIKKQH